MLQSSTPTHLAHLCSFPQPSSSAVCPSSRSSGPKVRKRLLGTVPIVSWLPRYPFRENALGDFISGISVGIMQLPQGEHEKKRTFISSDSLSDRTLLLNLTHWSTMAFVRPRLCRNGLRLAGISPSRLWALLLLLPSSHLLHLRHIQAHLHWFGLVLQHL